MGAAERRQLILDLLCQRRRETISNLAAELGVSERTIRRQRLTPRQTALLRRLAAGLQGEDLEDMKQILTQFAS